ncbi:MAG: class II aldolase/adducin family protein [Polyangiaceae bacterium]|nr:class II aldolase/adducin family protein [Myxococcales bacterium]MCB9584614.1 class II aldolase/adducin family protein [Polyangiaceae bacterium]
MLTAIGDVMRRLYERGWITTRDGNCSLRRTNSRMLYVTPSGWRKTILHPEHLVKLAFGANQELVVPEGANPSGELHMHWLLQKDATSVRAVVHAHPTHVVAAIYRGFKLPDVAAEFPEIFRYTRVGPSVTAIPAITRDLGDATAVAFGLKDGQLDFDIVGQANHGVCAVAGDPWSAYEHIERLNHVCEIVLASGVRPEDIPEGSIRMKSHGA